MTNQYGERGATQVVMPDSPVFTSDGHKLGKVKEVRNGCFKVDVRMAPDYWLGMACVGSVTSDGVMLSVDKDHLDDAKVDPDHFESVTTYHEHGESYGGATGYSFNEGPAPAGAPVGTRTSLHGAETPGSPVGYESWDAAGPLYRGDWERQYGGSGRSWEDAEPGYRYGWEMARAERYRGQDWSDVEPHLAGGYSDWRRNFDYVPSDDAWQRSRDDVYASWERTRGSMDRG